MEETKGGTNASMACSIGRGWPIGAKPVRMIQMGRDDPGLVRHNLVAVAGKAVRASKPHWMASPK
jgi:hypothetical protein